MKTGCKKNGFSLTEMIVVVSIIALLASLGLPAIRSLKKSFESGSGANSIINAALSSARALAAKEQRYAGIRFELDFHDNQYMIFIIHDPENTGLSNGFRALEGQKPIKLPDDVRVIDMMCRVSTNPETLRDDNLLVDSSIGAEFLDAREFSESKENYPDNQKSAVIRDTSCFSVLFSPSGKLILHPVRVRNRDGIYKPDNSISTKVSMDDIFNSPENIIKFNVGMFMQDDDWDGYTSGRGSLGTELSRNSFFIYEKTYFDKLIQYSLKSGEDKRTIDYLRSLKPVYINQYTGTLINNWSC